MKENLNKDLAESPETMIDIPISEILAVGIPRNRKIKPGEIYDVQYVESANIEEDPNTGELVDMPATNLGKKYEYNLNQINFDRNFLSHRLQYDPTKIYDINELTPVARHFNNYNIQHKNNKAYIDFGQDINVNNLVQQYKNEHPDATRDEIQSARQSFRQLKDRGQQNYKTFKDARRYAGSLQDSASYKQFTNTMALGTGSAILGPWAAQGLATAGVLGWKAATSPLGQLLLGGYGAYELTSQNGVTKTWNHFKNGEIGAGFKSLAGDALNIVPLTAAYKGLRAGWSGLNAGLKTTNFLGNAYRTFNASNKLLNPAIREAEYFYNGARNFVNPTNIALGITGGAIAGAGDNATYNITKGKNYSVGDYLYTQVGKPGKGTGWEPVVRFGSEMVNPFNLYAPGTYAKNKLGQNLVNGVLDPLTNDLYVNRHYIDPSKVNRHFLLHPFKKYIDDPIYNVRYTRGSWRDLWKNNTLNINGNPVNANNIRRVGLVTPAMMHSIQNNPDVFVLAAGQNPSNIRVNSLPQGTFNNKRYNESLAFLRRHFPNLDPKELEYQAKYMAYLSPRDYQAMRKFIKNGTFNFGIDNWDFHAAMQIASMKKIDPVSYNSPKAIIDDFPNVHPKLSVSPDEMISYHNPRRIGPSITIYDVNNTRGGQADTRMLMDHHHDYARNPWCLIARQNGNLDTAWNMWQRYNSTNKQAAFENGKITSFYASRDPNGEWWNMFDSPSKLLKIGSPSTVLKLGKVETWQKFVNPNNEIQNVRTQSKFEKNNWKQTNTYDMHGNFVEQNNYDYGTNTHTLTTFNNWTPFQRYVHTPINNPTSIKHYIFPGGKPVLWSEQVRDLNYWSNYKYEKGIKKLSSIDDDFGNRINFDVKRIYNGSTTLFYIKGKWSKSWRKYIPVTRDEFNDLTSSMKDLFTKYGISYDKWE